MIAPLLELLVQLAIVSICIICQADSGGTPKRRSGGRPGDNSARKAASASRSKTSEIVVAGAAPSKEGINDEEAANLKRKFRTLQQKTSKLSVAKPQTEHEDKAKRTLKIKRRDKNRERDNEDATEFESVNAARKPALSKLKRKNSRSRDTDSASITSISATRTKNSLKKKDKKRSSARTKEKEKEKEIEKTKEKENEKTKEKETEKTKEKDKEIEKDKTKEKDHNETTEDDERQPKRSSSKRSSIAKEKTISSLKPNRPRPKTRRDESVPSVQPRTPEKKQPPAPVVAVSRDYIPSEAVIEYDMTEFYVSAPPSIRKVDEVSARDDEFSAAPTIENETEQQEVTCKDADDVEIDPEHKNTIYAPADRLINACFERNLFSSFLTPEEYAKFNDFFKGHGQTNEHILAIVDKSLEGTLSSEVLAKDESLQSDLASLQKDKRTAKTCLLDALIARTAKSKPAETPTPSTTTSSPSGSTSSACLETDCSSTSSPNPSPLRNTDNAEK